MNIHVTVSDIRHDISKMREEIGGQVPSVSMNLILSIDNRRVLTVA